MTTTKMREILAVNIIDQPTGMIDFDVHVDGGAEEFLAQFQKEIPSPLAKEILGLCREFVDKYRAIEQKHLLEADEMRKTTYTDRKHVYLGEESKE